MATQHPTTDSTTADATASIDDEARDQIATPGDFFKGEWRNLWPVWTLAVIFLTLIVLATFGEL